MAADESDYAQGIWAGSPNFGFTAVGAQGRSDGKTTYKITGICMHGTSGLMPGCLEWLQNPVSKASVTYLVSRDGLVRQLVREDDVAWGNGDVEAPSTYLNGPDPNLFLLSIEHEMPNGNTGTLTPAQQAASIALITDIRRRHGALPLIPHHAIAPQSRAHCPGDAFPLALIDTEAQPAMRQLPNIPVWNQLSDALPDGNQDPQMANNCGDECVAMLIKAYGGPELPAGQIRMILHGITGTGITNAADLVRALAMFRDSQGRVIAAHSRQCDAATFRIEATRAINAGLPVIALGDWVTRGVAHWVIGRGADDTGIMVNDPWQGRNRLISWSDVAALYDGAYVHLDVSVGSLPV